ncbi:glycerol-3-phosphate acyltransferase [Spirulina major CS-329]|uniref:glycerol-3-phosphate acyltransferase n=1 Tax=Spirulina TaxID=1154 RepID=UPI00232E1993|nr:MULTISPECIES: glycerol-3-phosphate acyltransferase [Spirulina]MDB9495062.1 glycerol-3-phosphate acyltransferase [Spirulina subsalsa CS-330]MDB9504224.1 glycerol-3-phosphate acyltransferase [Spirulina major CS-329]
MRELWGSVIIFLICPVLGGLPVVDWLVRRGTGKRLRQLGTGNLSVSAAFYHGGRTVGIVAVCSEAAKGVIAVLLARWFFTTEPAWEIVALIALVMGRYWMGGGAGTTNVFWGIVAHDPIGAVVIAFLGLMSFTLVRERRAGRYVSLFWLVMILAVRQSGQDYAIAVVILAALMAWIYTKIPDDLELVEPTDQEQDTRTLFRFFRGDNAVLTLRDRLEPQKVGAKAATLATLKRWGYAVPEGWVLPAGDDPQPLILSLNPSPEQPLIVRSSAIGEDSATASAAGQYVTLPNITTPPQLEAAVLHCQTSYNSRRAVEYRRHHHQRDQSLAVLVQQQITGQYSGVAFSRDPVDQYRDVVVIEALPGGAAAVVSGQTTPEQYSVHFAADPVMPPDHEHLDGDRPELDDPAALAIAGEGSTPSHVLQQVARLCRDLEARYHGIPQDMEWTYDGETLWILQTRPITTLAPIWTRKIAAEVIPGAIRPLTWSINQPLTCGVWGKLFEIGLGDRAAGLDFDATATLHFSHAYFNATLLGEIFRRMGLPPESLEFLTRGAPMTKPPILRTLKNLPGLWRLAQREWRLPQDFARDQQKWFIPTLQQVQTPATHLSPDELLARVDLILSTLQRATYYNILAPLSAAIRQGILQVSEAELDTQAMPEVASVRALMQLAEKSRNLLPMGQLNFDSCPSLFAYLADMPDGQPILDQFNLWLKQYGYLSEVATDIAVPRWSEQPRPMRELFTRCVFDDVQRSRLSQTPDLPESRSAFAKLVQHRLDLKGNVAELYNRLLAQLRWTLLALEQQWLQAGLLQEAGDLFFLTLAELAEQVERDAGSLDPVLGDRLAFRKQAYTHHQALSHVPPVVYGQPSADRPPPPPSRPVGQTLKGIGVSPGVIEGRVQVVRSLQDSGTLAPDTVLIVPYTDAGWSPLLASAVGIVSEVGGRLSHGAILAREYQIPAVFDVAGVMQLHDGQWVRVDGQQGTIELIDETE